MRAAGWAACRQWLAPALLEDREADVLADIEAGRAQLWAGLAAAFVTQLVVDEDRYILVWLAGGELRELLAMQPGIEAWARGHGAAYAWIQGRKGWARVLRKSGFEPHGDGLRKVL